MFSFSRKKPVEVAEVSSTDWKKVADDLQERINRLNTRMNQNDQNHELAIQRIEAKNSIAVDKIKSAHDIKVKELTAEITNLKNTSNWIVEKARQEVRTELTRDAYLADLAKTSAEAKLEVYEATDRKDERNQLHGYFEKMLEVVKASAKREAVTVNTTHSAK